LQITPNRVLFSFYILVWLCDTPPSFNKYVMEPKQFLIFLKRGITHALCNFGHKQYPSHSLDQNNSIHSVYKLPSWGYCIPSRFCLGNAIPLQKPMVFAKKSQIRYFFPSRFWYGYAIPLQDSSNILWSQRNCNIS
jgi:hypothetical protein